LDLRNYASLDHNRRVEGNSSKKYRFQPKPSF
jgi:hypothetical protein